MLHTQTHGKQNYFEERKITQEKKTQISHGRAK